MLMRNRNTTKTLLHSPSAQATAGCLHRLPRSRLAAAFAMHSAGAGAGVLTFLDVQESNFLTHKPIWIASLQRLYDTTNKVLVKAQVRVDSVNYCV